MFHRFASLSIICHNLLNFTGTQKFPFFSSCHVFHDARCMFFFMHVLAAFIYPENSHTGMERPPSSMAWLQADNITLLRELCAHCTYVAACQHNLDVYKSWAFCASFPSIASPACTCNQAPGVHQSIANAKVGNTR